MFNPKWAIGRTITAIEMRSQRIVSGGVSTVMHYPTLTLDNGAKLVLVAIENPEGGEHGVYISYLKP